MDRVMKLKAEIEEIRALLNNAAADIGSIQCNLKELMEWGIGILEDLFSNVTYAGL